MKKSRFTEVQIISVLKQDSVHPTAQTSTSAAANPLPCKAERTSDHKGLISNRRY
jgi:hypothetical protein